MADRAIVTSIDGEHVTDDGISVYAHFIVVGPGHGSVVSAITVTLDPAADNPAWKLSVQTAVSAACAEMPDPFTVDPADVLVSVLG